LFHKFDSLNKCNFTIQLLQVEPAPVELVSLDILDSQIDFKHTDQ